MCFFGSREPPLLIFTTHLQLSSAHLQLSAQIMKTELLIKLEKLSLEILQVVWGEPCTTFKILDPPLVLAS